MVPLTPDEIEQKLGQLEEQIAELENRDTRAAMEEVLKFLTGQRTLKRQEHGELDRAIERIRQELGELGS